MKVKQKKFYLIQVNTMISYIIYKKEDKMKIEVKNRNASSKKRKHENYGNYENKEKEKEKEIEKKVDIMDVIRKYY